MAMTLPDSLEEWLAKPAQRRLDGVAVAKHGCEYERRVRHSLPMLTPKWCFLNAAETSREHGLTYVEGFARPPYEPWAWHAWNLDAKGRIVDRTWPMRASRYFGVAFLPEAVEDVLLARPTGDAGTVLVAALAQGRPLGT